MSGQPVRSDFDSQGTRCAADLWRPPDAERSPVVVMAHGLAALRTFGLERYARRFVDAGLAVLRFDYRRFGESDGLPRQIVDHRRQLEDWAAAIEHARSLSGVDGTRLALWGTSYSGGHVLATAARDHRIDAVVAQVPFVDGIATLRHLPLRTVLRVTGHSLRDVVRMATSREPHYIPVAARPGELAALNRPGSWEGYMKLVPGDAPWENRLAARIALTLPFYRPTAGAGRIRCPVQLLYAERDLLNPAAAAERVVERIPNVEAIREPYGHFDVYDGPEFERAVRRQVDFLVRHLA